MPEKKYYKPPKPPEMPKWTKMKKPIVIKREDIGKAVRFKPMPLPKPPVGYKWVDSELKRIVSRKIR